MKIPITTVTLDSLTFEPKHNKEYIVGCDIEKQTITITFGNGTGESETSFEDFNKLYRKHFALGHLTNEQLWDVFDPKNKPK